MTSCGRWAVTLGHQSGTLPYPGHRPPWITIAPCTLGRMTPGDHYPGQPYGEGYRGGMPPHGPPPGGGYGPPGAAGPVGPDPYGSPGYGQQPRYGEPPDPYPPAAPGFGGGQFSEPPGFGPPPPPPKGGSRFWLTSLTILAVLVVIAACSVGGYFVFRDDGTPIADPSAGDPTATSAAPSGSPSPSAEPVDISSRTTDPRPLTVRELFPAKRISVQDDNTGKTHRYSVVKTQLLRGCGKAVTGKLPTMLQRLGCTQVARAAINSADGKYGATAGVFNLKKKGHSATIDPVIKKDQGSFTGLEGTGASAKINKASLMMYWQEQGHYMVYVIICRGDGKQISNKDSRLGEMGTDLLISHLATKLAERTGTVDN